MTFTCKKGKHRTQEFVNFEGPETEATLAFDGIKYTIKGKFSIALTKGDNVYPDQVEFQVFSKEKVEASQQRGEWNRAVIYLPRELASAISKVLITDKEVK